VNNEYKIQIFFPLAVLFSLILIIICLAYQMNRGEKIGFLDIFMISVLIYSELYFLRYSCRIENSYLVIRNGIYYEKKVYIPDIKDIEVDKGFPFFHSAILVLKNKKKIPIFPLKNGGELIEKMTKIITV